MRVRVVPSLVLIALAAIALPSSSTAQVQQPPSPHREGETQGEEDGRRFGRDDGIEIGRSQALLESYFEGFRGGLARADRSAVSRERAQAADDGGRAAGRRTGLAAGLAAGQERGDLAASAAFLRLEGVPAFRSEAPEGAPQAPDPPSFDACDAPTPIRLWLPRGRSYDVDPASAERQDRSEELRVPDSPYPPTSDLRQEARRDGWADGDDVDDWVDGYREGFDETYEDAFVQERNNTNWSLRREWEDDGHDAGLAEGARRMSCDAFHAGHRRGFNEGFDEGFARGFAEGWDGAVHRHQAGPVIVLESARLVDASADGVFEPGEPVAAELLVTNSGLVDARENILSLVGVQSLDAQRRIDAPLPAQSRRAERVELGAVGQGAPLGATAIVDLLPLRGRQERLSVSVSRPVLLDEVLVSLDVRDDRLVRVVRGILRSTATTRVDRSLRVVAEDEFALVPPLEAGAKTDVAVLLPATPDDLDASPEAEMRLEGDGLTWMRRRSAAATAMERATELAARLPLGGAEERAALPVLSRRLAREYEAALVDPKLYKRLDRSSELVRYATALRALPPDRARRLHEAVTAPLLARARAKGTPRKVRSAVQDALDPR